MKHPLIWTLLIISALNCTNQRADVLAIIGKRTVTIDDFATRYKSIRQKMNLPDNGQVRKEIFRNLVNEELLIAEAVSRGYPDDPMGKYEHERLKIQELLNAYLQKIVFKNIPVNEEELKALYIRLNTKIKARHLYAASRKQADSLYSELMKGTSFEQLAKETFTDPQLRDTGGSLGYFTVDEMDPFFEDAAFALDIGEISKPIRTAQGYSIIQVQDRITKPLLTESEYAKHRANLEQYWRYRKMKKLTRSYVDSLRHYLDISFHKPVVSELFQSIKKRTPAPAGVEDRYYLLDVERLDYKELVRSKLGVWEVKTFRQYAQFTSEEQLKWVRNEENLEDFIAGLVVRAYLLSRAKKLGLHKSDAYQKNVKQKMDEYLLKRMEETILAGILIPEDTLQAYFQQNKEQFLVPAKIHLREMIVNNESKAVEIKNQLLKNASFEKLAKEHSVHRWSAEHDGDIGWFTYQELGSYAELIFPLKVGQWVGPIKIDTQFAFFKCIGKDSQRALTFDEARSEIEKILKPIWQRKAKQKFLENIRQQIKVVMYPEKLKSIQLN